MSEPEPVLPRPGLTVVVPVRAGVSEAMAKRIGNAAAALGGGRFTMDAEVEDEDDPDLPWAFLHLGAAADPAEVQTVFPGCWTYRTEVHVVWDAVRRRQPAISRTVLLQRAPSIDHAEFVRRWTVGHAELARRHHPGICRYVQRVVVDVLSPDAPPADGVASLAYAEVADFELRQYDSPEGEAIIQADVADFLDRSAGRRIVAREHDVASRWA